MTTPRKRDRFQGLVLQPPALLAAEFAVIFLVVILVLSVPLSRNSARLARDPLLAGEVMDRDDKVDAFYESIFRNLLSHMMENPASITSAAQLLFVARNIERIGDHATNVAEMVHYAATGRYLPERDEAGEAGRD